MPSPRPIVSLLILTAAFSAPPARAQGPNLAGAVPAPEVPEILERSGLIMRQTPIIPHLPPDPKRDQWYDTRWADPPNMTIHPNYYRNGGLYGLPWKATHTQSFFPFFFGAPGNGTLNADVRHLTPLARFKRSFTHPFKPIGMYYDQGSFSPVYDLDPLVPGPGAAPYVWPFYRRLTSAGG